MTNADPTHAEPNDAHRDDPVADDIASRNPDTDDIVAGEQVLGDARVAPEPDDLTEGETRDDRLHAAEERTDPGAPPAQGEPAA